MISKNVKRRVHGYIELAMAMKPAKQTGRFYHVTFICKKRKVIAVGFNNLQKLLNTNKWGEYLPTKSKAITRYEPGIHSELAAIIKGGFEDYSDYDFFNIRINNLGQIASSKPCVNCQRILKQVGFNHVYYFDEDLKIKML